MGMTMEELLTTFSFHVELDGIDIGAFKEASGVDSETQIIEYKEALANGKQVIRKTAGAMKWADITLKRAIDSRNDLSEWRKLVVQGLLKDAKKDGSIVLYNSEGGEVARWNFRNGWPSKWKGADLNAGDDNVAVEEITICHEGLERA